MPFGCQASPALAREYIVKSLLDEGAGIATVNRVERRTELDFAVRPDVVAG
jgi:hypothetical protein